MAAERDPPLSLWWAPLDVPAAELAALTAGLSAGERQRAAGLTREPERFLAARGWLRRLLAGELGCGPGDVELVADEGGKPRVAGGALRFSASRSAGLALYATSRTLEVGVDVEAIREAADVDAIARRVYSESERRVLAALPPAERLTACFQCWTHKEAYGKGTGAGLSLSLPAVDAWDGTRSTSLPGGWSVHRVDGPPGFAAAVAGLGLGGWAPGAPDELPHSGYASGSS